MAGSASPTAERSRAGAVKPLHYFGRELVVFRGEDGVAHVLDAHCPHLGAHLGFGGRVEGGALRCPFHGWLWNGDGRCLEVPYAGRVPAQGANPVVAGARGQRTDPDLLPCPAGPSGLGDSRAAGVLGTRLDPVPTRAPVDNPHPRPGARGERHRHRPHAARPSPADAGDRQRGARCARARARPPHGAHLQPLRAVAAGPRRGRRAARDHLLRPRLCREPGQRAAGHRPPLPVHVPLHAGRRGARRGRRACSA